MVKRYDLDDVEDTGQPSINEWPDGRYVLYEDYQKLETVLKHIATIELAPSERSGIALQMRADARAALVFLR